MAVTPPRSPFQIIIVPGLALAVDLYYQSRASVSADSLPIDLTGYAPADVLVKAGNDETFPLASDDTKLTITATLANQTGADQGKLQLRASASATAALADGVMVQGRGDVVLESSGEHSEVWDHGVFVVVDPISAAPTVSGTPTYNPTVIERIMVAGPTGSEPVSSEISVDFTATGGTTIYTSASDNETPLRAKIRITAVDTVNDVPTIYFRKVGTSTRYMSNLTLTGTNAVGEARNIVFTGNIPTLATGEAIEIVVATAADATTYTGAVSVSLA